MPFKTSVRLETPTHHTLSNGPAYEVLETNIVEGESNTGVLMDNNLNHVITGCPPPTRW
jgi:hypothetical protein